MQDMEPPVVQIGLVPCAIYILSSFIANVGVAVTGFGMGLIFIFVYTLFDVGGMMTACDPVVLCDMKYAVFIQSLSLAGSMPLLMYKSNIRTHANKLLLFTLIPVTLISTPIGQLLQDHVSSSLIRIILGLVVTAVVGWEIIKLFRTKQSSTNEAVGERETDETGVNGTQLLPTEQTSLLINSKKIGVTSEGLSSSSNDDENGDFSEFSKNSILLWGIVLGFLSGFLGGLIGMRGPPLMIFFLHFPFPKAEARAVGSVMLFLNMLLRVSFYIIEDLRASGTTRWFYWEQSFGLYVSVVVAGIFGVPIGDWIHHHIDQKKFRFVLALLLSASGLVNIVKGANELLSS